MPARMPDRLYVRPYARSLIRSLTSSCLLQQGLLYAFLGWGYNPGTGTPYTPRTPRTPRTPHTPCTQHPGHCMHYTHYTHYAHPMHSSLCERTLRTPHTPRALPRTPTHSTRHIHAQIRTQSPTTNTSSPTFLSPNFGSCNCSTTCVRAPHLPATCLHMCARIHTLLRTRTHGRTQVPCVMLCLWACHAYGTHTHTCVCAHAGRPRRNWRRR